MKKTRLMALAFPFLYAVLGVFVIVTIPVAIVFAGLMLVRPQVMSVIQARLQKRMIHEMFSHMTRKATA